MNKPSIKPIVLCLALALPLTSLADERESLESLRNTTLNLIQALVQQGVLSKEKAEEIVRQASSPAPASGPATDAAASAAGGAGGAAAGAAEAPAGKDVPKSVRVPYVPEFVKRELKDQVKAELLAQAKAERWVDAARLPEWLDRFSFSGDVTLRFEDDTFRPPCDTTGATSNSTSCNVPAVLYNQLVGTNLNNTTVNRQLLRLRATEGAEIRVNDHTTAEFRLSTGNLSNPVTNFQTLGASFGRPAIGLNQASIRYEPLDWLRLQGGRFTNPFLGTDLLWYDRLGFDGAYVQGHPRVSDALELFGTLGAFPLQDFEPTATSSVKSKWLYGSQVGGRWKIADATALKFGLGYYDFTHVEGVVNDATGNNNLNGNSAPLFTQKGNTLFNINQLNGGAPVYALASKFRELDLTSQLDLAQFNPVHVLWTVDVARNLGFDANEINARAGGGTASLPLAVLDPRYGGLIRPRVNAWGSRLTVGSPTIHRAGEWQGYMGYKYVERDAVLDAFNDPDFHLGGTDAKGWLAGGSLGIDRDTWLTLKYFSAQAIDGLPLSIDVLQADFNTRF